MPKHIHTEAVIEEVRRRPVLWDPTHLLTKDRVARGVCWQEVYETLYPDYRQMDLADRKDIAKMTQQRWRTARDAYNRCKKYQEKGINKKHYGFSDELRFLDKIKAPEEADSSATHVECELEDHTPTLTPTTYIKEEPREPSDADTKFEASEEQIWDPIDPCIEPEESVEDATERRLRKRKASDGFQTEMMDQLRDKRKRKPSDGFQTDMDQLGDSKLLRNDDLAFFISLLPITRKFSVQQKLAFRMKILEVAMEISKTKRETKSDSESDE